MVLNIQRSKGRAVRDQKGSTSIPGTYQISIRRVDEMGEENCFTCYVPTSPKGLKELIRRHFRGVPGLKRPQYFMKENEYRRF